MLFWCWHRWKVYDVYWIGNPSLGNERCEKCGKRRKGVPLSDDEVNKFVAERDPNGAW